jgi:hypothetical protein
MGWARIAKVIGILVALLTFPASAQVTTFQAVVPFPFVVGNQTLPAGAYIVQRYLGRPKKQDGTGLIVMKGNHHLYKVIVTGSSDVPDAGRTEVSRLIFTTFAGKQYLNRIWVEGDAVAHQLVEVPPAPEQGTNQEVIVTGQHRSKER